MVCIPRLSCTCLSGILSIYLFHCAGYPTPPVLVLYGSFHLCYCARGFVKFPDTLVARIQPRRVAHSDHSGALHWIPRNMGGYIGRKEQANIKKPSVAQWLAGAGPLSPHREGAMFDSRHGGLSPPRLGGVEFLFFAWHVFFVALGGFCLMMARSRTSPCLIFFIRECMGPWYIRSFKTIWIMNYAHKAKISQCPRILQYIK